MSLEIETSTQPAVLFLSIRDAAVTLALSQWAIKDLLRRDVLKGRKHGRRTLVTVSSIRAYADGLPSAKFLPVRSKGA
jgi:hypothetical protein